MAKKCKCPPEGAPEWVLTYGDMMSLLLCFFIILVSLSEIKKEDQYQAIVAEVKKAFGMKGGGGKMATRDDPELSLIKRLEELQLRQTPKKQVSNTDDPGIHGKDPEVTRVREGMLITQGGKITFEPGSADLSQEAKKGIRVIADLVRGYNNKIELRGHAASMEKGVESAYPDLWTLSYARAKAVMEFMVSKEMGIRSDRIRLIANADTEPLAQRVYTSSGQQPNRRAEILVMEALVDDFTKSEYWGF